MKRLVIVRVIPFFARRFGGPVAQGRAVARRLAERGHDVRVVTTDLGVGGVGREQWTEEDGYRVWYGRTAPWNRVVPYFTPMLRRPLEKAVADADVLCLNVGLTLANALARRVARARRVPYVYNAEGALCPLRLGVKRLRKRAFIRLFERPVVRDAAALQAVTAQEAVDLHRVGADAARIHCIPNGVEVEDGEARADPAGFRARYRIGPGARVVLFLGRLHPLKGLDLLLRGVARAAAGEVVVVLAGPDEGGCRRRSERLAAELGVAVRFPGELTGADRSAALGAADVFALTSRSEGLPNAVLEAAAAGIPVLVSEGCHLPEVAARGAGRIARLDPDDIGRALGELLASEALRAAMGEAGRRMVAECFSLAAVVSRLEELYAELAAGGGARGA